jgi:LemA protein
MWVLQERAMEMWLAISVFAAVCAVAAIVVVATYNRFVLLSGHCDNAFAQIEVQLKRRYDLIPNLVECVRSYMAHERDTLERVIVARNQAAAGLQKAARQPGDADAVNTWMGAEGALTGALSRLSVVMESYPELKANASVADLTEQLTSTENRIAYARQAYNDWVTGFNSQRQTFPNCLFAGLLGFGENRKLLEFAEGEKLRVVPLVVLT